METRIPAPDAGSALAPSTPRKLTIRDISLTPIVVPFDGVYRGSYYRMENRASVITRVVTDEGIVGEAYAADEEKTLAEIVGVIRDETAPRLATCARCVPAAASGLRRTGRVRARRLPRPVRGRRWTSATSTPRGAGATRTGSGWPRHPDLQRAARPPRGAAGRSLHLLASQPHGIYVEAFHPNRGPIWWNVIANRPQVEDGSFATPDGLGLGWELDAEFVEHQRVDV